jgi:hypothetical protein
MFVFCPPQQLNQTIIDDVTESLPNTRADLKSHFSSAFYKDYIGGRAALHDSASSQLSLVGVATEYIFFVLLLY